MVGALYGISFKSPACGIIGVAVVIKTVLEVRFRIDVAYLEDGVEDVSTPLQVQRGAWGGGIVTAAVLFVLRRVN